MKDAFILLMISILSALFWVFVVFDTDEMVVTSNLAEVNQVQIKKRISHEIASRKKHDLGQKKKKVRIAISEGIDLIDQQLRKM